MTVQGVEIAEITESQQKKQTSRFLVLKKEREKGGGRASFGVLGKKLLFSFFLSFFLWYLLLLLLLLTTCGVSFSFSFYFFFFLFSSLLFSSFWCPSLTKLQFSTPPWKKKSQHCDCYTTIDNRQSKATATTTAAVIIKTRQLIGCCLLVYRSTATVLSDPVHCVTHSFENSQLEQSVCLLCTVQATSLLAVLVLDLDLDLVLCLPCGCLRFAFKQFWPAHLAQHTHARMHAPPQPPPDYISTAAIRGDENR